MPECLDGDMGRALEKEVVGILPMTFLFIDESMSGTYSKAIVYFIHLAGG